MSLQKEYPKIDFVVTWLDSNDPKWKKEYKHYKGINIIESDSGMPRYRDWNLFHFWFRAVEQYAPWVNKIFLVTNGTFPKWINTGHPKLVLVNHRDYIPEEFLPTFNSCTIELHMNKIEGLSEHFVYFNDDCYLNAPISPDFYFKQGLPCDRNKESFFNVACYNPKDRFNTFISIFTDVSVLNGHFQRPKVIKKSLRRWFGPHLGLSGLFISWVVTTYRFQRFVGFKTRHNEQPFLRSVMDEAWKEESDMLNKSCTRFREDVILNPYFFRYWQFATNKFYPVSLRYIDKYQIRKENVKHMIRALNNKKTKSLCLNDCYFCPNEDFVWIQTKLQQEFEKKFPKKSSFEK